MIGKTEVGVSRFSFSFRCFTSAVVMERHMQNIEQWHLC